MVTVHHVLSHHIVDPCSPIGQDVRLPPEPQRRATHTRFGKQSITTAISRFPLYFLLWPLFMHVAQPRARGSRIVQSFALNCRRRPLKACAYSSRSRLIPGEVKMFKKAVKDHPVGTAKPLQSNFLRANTIVPPKPLPAQSVGVKRKVEMANGGGETTLGSLHSTVYFDENDFDDDLDLDIDEPVPFTAPSAPSVAKTDAVKYPTIDLTSPDSSNSAAVAESKTQSDVAYPELPPASQEQAAPPSSIQYPWSSSPPSHFQPPPKPRTLPWLKEVKEESHQDKANSHKTPKRPKPAEPWNKSASAIKDEQKELRREYKKSQKAGENTKQTNLTKTTRVCLSDEQLAVLESVVDRGKSIFFTGSAGTGKSVLMREIIKALRGKYCREPDRVAVTASTGLAACNIEGVTLHSFAGIGLGKEAVPELVKKVSHLLQSNNVSMLTASRSKRTRKHATAGCARKCSSSMKCPWSMVIYLTNLRRLRGACATTDVRLEESS